MQSKTRTAVFLTFIILLLNAPMNLAQNDDPFECPDTLPPRLTIGYRGRVLPGDANRIRDEPSLEGESLGFIPGEAEFNVNDGPVCADGFVWWRVFYEGRGVPGSVWTAEGSSDEYWLEPLYVPNTIIDFTYRGVSLSYSNNHASAPTGSTVEVGAAGTDGTVDALQISYNDRLPTYVESGEVASITIIPLDEYVALGESAANEVDALVTMLETQTFPEGLDQPPFVPVVNAEQPYQALPRFLEFQNGIGVRYLTTPTENFVVVSDTTPDYTFVGVTNDRSQLISVSLPMNVSIFPESSEEGSPYQTDDDGSSYAQYLMDVEAQLENATIDDFTPFLPAYDMMMESLLVEVAPPAPTLELSPDDVTYEFPDSVGVSLVGEYLDIEPFADFTGEEAPPVLRFEFEMAEGQFNSNWNQILIYPVALTEELNLRDFSDLAEALENRPSPVPIVSGPRINAGAPLATRADYIDFQNGSGIRYIAHITQDYTQVSPLYIFTGLSDDGLHYIEIIYFLRSDALLNADITQELYATSVDDLSGFYGDYIDGVAEFLDSAAPDTFTPNLDDVDDFVRSIQIGGE